MALETYFLLQDVRFNENPTYLKGPTVIAFSGRDSKTLHAVAIQWLFRIAGLIAIVT